MIEYCCAEGQTATAEGVTSSTTTARLSPLAGPTATATRAPPSSSGRNASSGSVAGVPSLPHTCIMMHPMFSNGKCPYQCCAGNCFQRDFGP